MTSSVACQAWFALVVIHSVCFFGLGLVAFKTTSFPQNARAYICSNPSTIISFAATPLVLTRFVRNQRLLSGTVMPTMGTIAMPTPLRVCLIDSVHSNTLDFRGNHLSNTTCLPHVFLQKLQIMQRMQLDVLDK